MIQKIRHIAVSGNIGAGKTTLTEMLAKHYHWQPEYEDVDDNPYLADFYGDMSKWSFHLQVYFLNSRFEQVNKVRNGERTVIQDRTIYEDAYIFAKSLYNQGFFNERDYQNYLSLFNSMIDKVHPPNLLIYLRADIPRLFERIQKRGRDFEDTMSIDYLKNLNRCYEEWIANYSLGKLLIIDVSNLDFVENTEDFGTIIDKVDVELLGV